MRCHLATLGEAFDDVGLGLLLSCDDGRTHVNSTAAFLLHARGDDAVALLARASGRSRAAVERWLRAARSGVARSLTWSEPLPWGGHVVVSARVRHPFGGIDGCSGVVLEDVAAVLGQQKELDALRAENERLRAKLEGDASGVLRRLDPEQIAE
ncbi:MAG: hypothetical protein RLP09_29815 [Sandaracinaceae bacterium]